MDVLKKLNNKAESESKPYNGLPKLAIGNHKIVHLRESHGKFGRSVIVELQTEIIFLPSYISGKLNETDIDKLNDLNKKDQLFLFFGGKQKNKKYWILKIVSEPQKFDDDSDDDDSDDGDSDDGDDDDDGSEESQDPNRKIHRSFIMSEAKEKRNKKKKNKVSSSSSSSDEEVNEEPIKKKKKQNNVVSSDEEPIKKKKNKK